LDEPAYSSTPRICAKINGMGLDQPALQWLFNVVMITGFTSLAVLCYVQKEDNKRLTLELAQRGLRNEKLPIPMKPSAAGPISEDKIGSKASPLEHQDIRHFVALRSQNWVPSRADEATNCY
jgi:hypothetical protein